MNKVLFLVFAAIVAGAMAARIYADELICALSGTGTAVVTGMGSFPFRVIRVDETVRYDLLKGSDIAGTLLFRPELNREAYFWVPNKECVASYADLGDISRYYLQDEKSEEGYDVYSYSYNSNQYGKMFFKGKDLVREYYNISDSYYEMSLEVTFNYKSDSLNYEFEHNTLDDLFSISDEECPDSYALASPATKASTFSYCGKATLPENLCSVSGEATGFLQPLSSGSFKEVNVKMVRVKNTVRYDIIDKQYQTPFGSLIYRPDLGDTYLVIPSSSESCQTFNVNPRLSRYEPYELQGNFEIFRYSSQFDFNMYVTHNERKLFAEMIELEIDNKGYMLYFNYTKLDYKYSHDKIDDIFSVDDDSCPELKENSRYAKTSMQCKAAKVLKPELPSCLFEVDINFPVDNIYAYYWGGGYKLKIGLNESKINVMNVVVGTVYDILVRCDISEDGKCVSIIHYFDLSESGYQAYGGCMVQYEEFDDLDMASEIVRLLPLSGFEYRCEPVEVKCPGNYTGKCKKYCACDDDSYEDECIIFDKENRVVGLCEDDEVLVVEYVEDDITVDDFKGVMCNKTIIEPPAEICLSSTSLPSLLLVSIAFVLALFF